MSLSTLSEPDCSGMCSEGITFGVSAIASMTSSVNSAGCGLVNRTRSRPSISPQARSSLREGLPVAELHAVGVDVLAQQGDLADALGDQRLDLGEDLAGPAVLLLAAQRGDDAERAGVVAADRDRHPGGVRRVALGRQRRGEHLERLEDLDLRLLLHPRPLQQHRQRADVVGAEDDVDVRRLARDRRAVLLRQAAADGDLHARVGGLDRREVRQVAVELVVGVLAHRAGVEDDHVGVVRRRRGGERHVAGVLQQPGQALGVVDVHLAPVGADLVGARWLPVMTGQGYGGRAPSRTPSAAAAAGQVTVRSRFGRSTTAAWPERATWR